MCVVTEKKIKEMNTLKHVFIVSFVYLLTLENNSNFSRIDKEVSETTRLSLPIKGTSKILNI